MFSKKVKQELSEQIQKTEIISQENVELLKTIKFLKQELSVTKQSHSADIENIKINR